MDDMNVDDFIQDPNGNAYEKKEERTGPPLDYVAEKLRSSLQLLHGVHKAIERYVPDDLPQPQAASGTSYSTKRENLLSPAAASFRYGVTAYLALNNMLAVAHDQSLFSRLLEYSYDEFKNWLDRVDRGGSVTG